MHIRQENQYPIVVIIRGSLRAGKTLKTTEHIRLWIESPLSKTDTPVQSEVGRSLGYEEDGHSHFGDVYPIYCNTDQIQDALAFYDQFYHFDGLHIIPRGNWNERAEKGRGYRQKIAHHIDDVPADIRNAAYWGRQSKVSANNQKDLARYVLNGYKPTGKAPVIVIDGPNPNHLASWRELITTLPNAVGCIAYYVPDEQAEITEDQLRKDILLR